MRKVLCLFATATQQPWTTLKTRTSSLDSDLQLSSAERARAADERDSTFPERLQAGALAGQYKVEKVLGSGGGGVIYAARHRVLGREVAVKVLRREMVNSPTMVARFVREATTVNTIRHRNIVDIYEFGELPDGRPYYVMELLKGTDLRKLLRRHGRYSPEEALALFEQICQGLEAAHNAGVVHRDLKASNIVVCEGADGQVIKLVDFGIAKLLHPEPGAQGLTEAGVLMGTTHNMAPEQIRGEKVDERTDIYGLGVVLYQVLTGQLPFTSERREDITWMHLQTPAPRPSQAAPVSAAVDEVVLRCMEKDPARRYPNVVALISDFRKACGKSTAGLEQLMSAVGVYVELRVDEAAGDDLEDDLVDEISMVLDTAEQTLRAADFSLPIQMSNALLAVKLLVGLQATADRSLAINLAQSLETALTERPNKDARLHVNISVRADLALVRANGAGTDEVVGGPLLNVNEWAAQAPVDHVFVNDPFETTMLGRT